MTLFLAGLCACYFAGYKFGVLVSWITKLGNSA